METRNGRTDPAREFLRSALEAEAELEQGRERLEELTARCERVTAGWSGAPAGRGEGPERLWARLADARVRVGKMEERAARRRRAVARAIGGVDDPAGREVLALRYLEGLSWPAIRERMGCSERTVFRLHIKAATEAGRTAGVL